MSAKQAMSVAQRLYEKGYITYMRTDSTALSTQAVQAARSQAVALYGDAAVPLKPRVYKSKSKNAQEAHEAIRPSGEQFRTPASVSSQLDRDELRLYDLIWKRTVACQMSDAKYETTTVTLAVHADGRDGRVHRVRHRHHLPRLPRGVRGGHGTSSAATPTPPRTSRCPRSRSGTCSASRMPRPSRTAPPRRRATPRLAS